MTITRLQIKGYAIFLFYLSAILPSKLTENTFSFAATTWGIVTGERRGINEPIVNWLGVGYSRMKLCLTNHRFYFSLH
jgi:hypothetical protein